MCQQDLFAKMLLRKLTLPSVLFTSSEGKWFTLKLYKPYRFTRASHHNSHSVQNTGLESSLLETTHLFTISYDKMSTHFLLLNVFVSFSIQ